MLKLFTGIMAIGFIISLIAKPTPMEVLDTHTGQWETPAQEERN